MIEGVGIDSITAREELLRLRKALREDDRVVLDGDLDGLLSDLGDRVQSVGQADILQSGNEAHVYGRDIQRLHRSGRSRKSSRRIDASDTSLSLRNVHRGRDDEIDALLVRVPEPGLLLKSLDDLAEGKAFELQLIEPDPIQLVVDHLPTAARAHRVGGGVRIGLGKLGQFGGPVDLHFNQASLGSQLALGCRTGILPFFDGREVVVSCPAVRVDFQGFLEFSSSLLKLAEFEEKLAVMLVGTGLDHLLALVADRLQSLIRRRPPLHLLEALIVLTLQALGEGVGGIHGQDALQTGIRLLVIAVLEGADNKFHVDGGEPLDSLGALSLDRGTKLLHQTPSLFIGLGSGAKITLLLLLVGGIQGIAQNDGLFLPTNGLFFSHLAGTLAHHSLGRCAHEENAEETGRVGHGFLYG